MRIVAVKNKNNYKHKLITKQTAKAVLFAHLKRCRSVSLKTGSAEKSESKKDDRTQQWIKDIRLFFLSYFVI